jgi:hypothetical protein
MAMVVAVVVTLVDQDHQVEAVEAVALQCFL